MNQVSHDLGSRGFVGASSVGNSEIGNIRNQQYQQGAAFQQNLGVQANNEAYQRAGNFLNSINGTGNNASQNYGNAGQSYTNYGQGQLQGFGDIGKIATSL